jgi:DNA-binding IclR family transcriptional regulator
MSSPTQAAAGGVQVLSRAAAVLRALHGHPQGMSLSEIAEEVGLPRSTVHRLTTALSHEGFIEAASAGGRLRIGPEIVRLARGSRPELREELRPFLEMLAAELGETVDCALLEGDHMRFIDQIPAPHRLRAVSAVGASFPLHCTANGKAALALMGRERAQRLLPARLERFTPATITRRTELLAELDRIAESGVAFDLEEHSAGICAAGIAVTDIAGRTSAVSVPMPAQRFAGRERELERELVRVRALIIKALGGEQALPSR